MQSIIVKAGLAIFVIVMMAGCAEEVPPRSVAEMVENPHILEAALVICARDRSATRYEAECINARQAVRRVEAKAEALRRKEWEAQSERKRLALRKNRDSVREARDRVAAAQQQNEEAQYAAMFSETETDADRTNAANNEIQPSDDRAAEPVEERRVVVSEESTETDSSDDSSEDSRAEELPQVDGSSPFRNQSSLAKSPTGLEAVREELRRRTQQEDD